MSTDPDPPSAPRAPRAAGARSCEIQLQNPCRYPEAAARRLRPWLEPLLAELAPAAQSFAVRFISDREMARLNSTFRHKTGPTDVLSFPGDGPEAHLGDVAISLPTARRQAAELGHPIERELRVLLLHGVLHCLGYDHEKDDGTMEKLEARLRKRWIDHDQHR